eukprot:697374-Pelagomonas_calceolata.AAC.2
MCALVCACPQMRAHVRLSPNVCSSVPVPKWVLIFACVCLLPYMCAGLVGAAVWMATAVWASVRPFRIHRMRTRFTIQKLVALGDPHLTGRGRGRGGGRGGNAASGGEGAPPAHEEGGGDDRCAVEGGRAAAAVRGASCVVGQQFA